MEREKERCTFTFLSHCLYPAGTSGLKRRLEKKNLLEMWGNEWAQPTHRTLIARDSYSMSPLMQLLSKTPNSSLYKTHYNHNPKCTVTVFHKIRLQTSEKLWFDKAGQLPSISFLSTQSSTTRHSESLQWSAADINFGLHHLIGCTQRRTQSRSNPIFRHRLVRWD